MDRNTGRKSDFLVAKQNKFTYGEETYDMTIVPAKYMIYADNDCFDPVRWVEGVMSCDVLTIGCGAWITIDPRYDEDIVIGNVKTAIECGGR